MTHETFVKALGILITIILGALAKRNPAIATSALGLPQNVIVGQLVAGGAAAAGAAPTTPVDGAIITIAAEVIFQAYKSGRALVGLLRRLWRKL